MRSLALLLALAATSACFTASAGAATLPPIKHVWIIVLENKSYADTFSDAGPQYLAKTMTAQGELLRQYYGTGHNSLDNYITMVSGQPPTDQTKADCPTFSDFTYSTPLGADGVAHGQGCVYPSEIKTIGDQLEGAGLTWKQYAEDQAASTTGEPPTCRHPAIGANDPNEGAKPTDQFATKHVPFLYFHSIIDRQAVCDANVVDLSALTTDLQSASTTPTYSFISPDLCSDGHDGTGANCVAGTNPGGYEGINNFLTTWVPRITDSPAYKEGGLLITTFDEASGKSEDCCGEPQGGSPPSPTYNGNGGNGGGQIGAVLLSQYVMAGSVNDKPYNHYSLLRSLEDQFGLPHLAYAANDGLVPFGDDVFNTNPTPSDRDGDGVFDSADACPDVAAATPTGCPATVDLNGAKPVVKVSGVPKKCVRHAFKAKVRVVSKRLAGVKSYVDGRRIKTSKTHKFSVKVKTGKLKKGKHRFKAVAKDKLARTGSKTVKFHVCR